MPWVLGQSELLLEVHRLQGVSIGVPPLAVAIIWDGQESTARCREAKLLAYCLRVTRWRRFDSFSCSLVFGSGVSEMSSSQQAVVAML